MSTCNVLGTLPSNRQGSSTKFVILRDFWVHIGCTTKKKNSVSGEIESAEIWSIPKIFVFSCYHLSNTSSSSYTVSPFLNFVEMGDNKNMEWTRCGVKSEGVRCSWTLWPHHWPPPSRFSKAKIYTHTWESCVTLKHGYEAGPMHHYMTNLGTTSKFDGNWLSLQYKDRGGRKSWFVAAKLTT